MGVIALYIKSSVLHTLGNLKLLLYFRRGEMPGMNNPKRRQQAYSEAADPRNLVSRKTARGWCPRDGHTQALGGSWHAQNISQASKNKHRGKYFGVRVWNYYLNDVTTSQQLDHISKGNNAEDESQVCCSICCSEKLFSVWHSFCSDRKYRLRQLVYTLFLYDSYLGEEIMWDMCQRSHSCNIKPWCLQTLVRTIPREELWDWQQVECRIRIWGEMCFSWKNVLYS